MADTPTEKLRLKTDDKTLWVTTERGLEVFIDDTLPDNGLSINSNGEIIATKGESGNPGSSGSVNLPGNGIGDPSLKTTDPVHLIGLNSTVSRHKHYTGTDTNIKTNDGVFVSSVDSSGNLVEGCLAHHIIRGG